MEQDYLLLRLESSLQSWGMVSVDRKRPTHRVPTPSALSGLIGNALGWDRAFDADRLNSLMRHLTYGAAEILTPEPLQDFQTAMLRESAGWTTRGIAEERDGGSLDQSVILRKDYLANGLFLVAMRIEEGAETSLDEVSAAMMRPARPVFLGRKACVPTSPLHAGVLRAECLRAALTNGTRETLGALAQDPFRPRPTPKCTRVRAWLPEQETEEGEPYYMDSLRNFKTDRFCGHLWFREFSLELGAPS